MTSEVNPPDIPRVVSSCDVRRLPLTPVQGYVLSRIDGTCTIGELSLMTGLSRAEVDSSIARLVELGAITLGDATPQPPPSRPAEGSAIAAEALSGMQGPAVETYTIPPSADGSRVASSLYDPSELDEDVDIPPDKRRRILDLYYQMEDLTYYEFLGIGHSADKKQIKEAYYALAAEFHPDRYFRKNIGSFKPKMEAVFSRITLAHDTLTKKGARGEYDAYLETQLKTRALEASMGGRESSRDLDSLRRAMAERAAVAEPMPSPSTPPVTDGRREPVDARRETIAAKREPAEPWGGRAEARRDATPPPAIHEEPRTGISSSPPEGSGSYASVAPRDPERDRQRREALAKRLLAGRSSKPPATQPQGPPSRANAESAAADLKRRYTERQAAMRKAQLQEAMRTANDAMRREDMATAANALRLAVELAPEDNELRQQLVEAQEHATKTLVESYLKQARYEEKSERWKEAARSYLRVVEHTKDNASVHAHTANAMVRAGLDLHVAAQYASRAVELEPSHPDHRATLAKVYIAAGLKLNARRELEIAAELAPGDANIAKLIKSLR